MRSSNSLTVCWSSKFCFEDDRWKKPRRSIIRHKPTTTKLGVRPGIVDSTAAWNFAIWNERISNQQRDTNVGAWPSLWFDENENERLCQACYTDHTGQEKGLRIRVSVFLLLRPISMSEEFQQFLTQMEWNGRFTLNPGIDEHGNTFHTKRRLEIDDKSPVILVVHVNTNHRICHPRRMKSTNAANILLKASRSSDQSDVIVLKGEKKRREESERRTSNHLWFSTNPYWR